jgi:hypothetical protein
MPSVVIDHVAGVALSDIMDAAGINLGSVQSFNFWTNDKQGGYYNSLTKSFLIDTTRYSYHSLPDNYDDENHTVDVELAVAEAWRVPTMIALADDWLRVIAGASFGSDYLNLDSSTRFRLVFGQTERTISIHTASDSAKWIHRIEVTLGGAPTLTMDASVLKLEVGSKFRTEARVHAADSVIAENAEVTWSSSDESVATVDENGEITVHSEGTATITAYLNGVESGSILVNGTPGTTIDNPNNGETGTDDGNGSDNGNATQTTVPQATPGTAASPTQPIASAQPAAPVEAKPVMLGREISILPPPVTQSENDEGGVQNWRADEMADTAVELPIIDEDNPMLVVAAVAFAVLFVCGGVFKLVQFKLSAEDKYVR